MIAAGALAIIALAFAEGPMGIMTHCGIDPPIFLYCSHEVAGAGVPGSSLRRRLGSGVYSSQAVGLGVALLQASDFSSVACASA